LFLGYYDAALNDRSFDAEGWFRTGDMAAQDADGYVTIKGRSKDVIIRGGENISAREVEDLLLEHPAVDDVAVVAMPDPVLVERACAFVVPREGAAVSLADLVQFMRTHDFAAQKLPEHLEVVNQLPRTTSGKVQKYKLRAAAAELAAAERLE
jgi:cyclohexanecarboxylate-CoA ligase